MGNQGVGAGRRRVLSGFPDRGSGVCAGFRTGAGEATFITVPSLSTAFIAKAGSSRHRVAKTATAASNETL